MNNGITIFPVQDIPIIENEQHLWEIFQNKLKNVIKDGDILVCAHTPFSRVMGYTIDLTKIEPSNKAIEISRFLEKEPKKIEAILQNSREIVKIGRKVIIAENMAGITCANAGLDESNAGIGKMIAVPDNPDKLASKIRLFVKEKLNKDIAVIISDTVGRALRRHAVNIAIGVSGLDPVKSYIGKKDLFGRVMRVSTIAIADELAAAAELIQGQSSEGNPFVIIRGYKYVRNNNTGAKDINRPKQERLFR